MSRSTRSPAKSSGSTPNQLGSPMGRRVLIVPRLRGRRPIPLIPFLFGSGTAPPSPRPSLMVALFAVGAATSIFTGRHAGRAGLPHGRIGAIVAAVTFSIGKAVGTTL